MERSKKATAKGPAAATHTRKTSVSSVSSKTDKKDAETSGRRELYMTIRMQHDDEKRREAQEMRADYEKALSQKRAEDEQKREDKKKELNERRASFLENQRLKQSQKANEKEREKEDIKQRLNEAKERLAAEEAVRREKVAALRQSLEDMKIRRRSSTFSRTSTPSQSARKSGGRASADSNNDSEQNV